MEFARQKEALFNRWCAFQQVGNNYEKLKQLVLLEEFKKCVPTPIKTYKLKRISFRTTSLLTVSTK